MTQAFTAILLALLGVMQIKAAEAPGDPFDNGLSLSISQTTNSNELILRFRNDSSETLYIVTNFLWWHCDIIANGKRIARWDDVIDMMLPQIRRDSFAKIEPGETLECALPLDTWQISSGDVVQVIYRNTGPMRPNADGKKFGLNAWMGTVTSNALKIETANQRLEGTAHPWLVGC